MKRSQGICQYVKQGKEGADNSVEIKTEVKEREDNFNKTKISTGKSDWAT